MEHIEQAVIDRFNSFYKRVGQCKLWGGALDKDGYGTFYFYKKARRAHRFAYYMAFGDIPREMFIDHICGKRNCVEASHLRVVTPTVNALENSRSLGAVNARKTHCIRGHVFDRKYGKQRYCSVCQAEKTKRLRKAWLLKANEIMC